MISGVHIVLFSKNPEADRAFFKHTLRFPAVDAGHGWLIFDLPPAEAAFHPAEQSGGHELYLMCGDLAAEIAQLSARGVSCSPIQQERWGSITRIQLPGGGQLALYQPKHPTALGLA